MLSYFLGKIGQVFVTGALQAALLLLVAGLVFRVPLPTEPERWLTFGWVFVLGVTTSAVLGIALSRIPRSGKSATSVVIPIALVLQFISGVYLAFTQLPDWLQTVASVFPLKWMAQGMRSAFLPDTFEALGRDPPAPPASPSPPSAPSSPNRCSCSPTRPSSGTSGWTPSAASASRAPCCRPSSGS